MGKFISPLESCYRAGHRLQTLGRGGSGDPGPTFYSPRFERKMDALLTWRAIDHSFPSREVG